MQNRYLSLNNNFFIKNKHHSMTILTKFVLLFQCSLLFSHNRRQRGLLIQLQYKSRPALSRCDCVIHLCSSSQSMDGHRSKKTDRIAFSEIEPYIEYIEKKRFQVHQCTQN